MGLEMIEAFNTLDDALFHIDHQYAMCEKDSYFKAEIYKTDDGRWRVGILTAEQLELDF